MAEKEKPPIVGGEKPKYTLIIEIYHDGHSKLIPNDLTISPDLIIDVLSQHIRMIEHNLLVVDVVAEMNEDKKLIIQ